MPDRARGFTITLNNYSKQEYDDIINIAQLHGEKWIFGKEIGEKCGTPHIQGYIYFKHTRTISACIKLFNNKRIHFEIAKGSIKDNLTYCSKEGNVISHNMEPTKKKKVYTEDELQEWFTKVMGGHKPMFPPNHGLGDDGAPYDSD